MNRKEVIALMESSESEGDWDANIDKVRAACGGYPDFWHEAIVKSGLADRVIATFGKSADIKVTALEMRPLNIHGRPTSMPSLQKGQQVIGVYNQGLGEKTIACSSLADMQRLYDSYASGMALTLKWCVATTS